MNGSENGYAGALFFALISLGALLKLDDVIGFSVGAIFALAAAVSLRRAMMQAAQAAEEDHQRMEIQFQQLRNKIVESSAANDQLILSFSDAAQVVQENLQVIRIRLAELDNLTGLAESALSIRSALNALDENSAALNAELEKIFVAVQEQNPAAVAEELKKISEIQQTNKESLQTALKLLQVVGQMLKNPSYAKDLEKITASLETLAARAAAAESTQPEPPEPSSTEGLASFNRQDLSLRKKIAAKLRRKSRDEGLGTRD